MWLNITNSEYLRYKNIKKTDLLQSPTPLGPVLHTVLIIQAETLSGLTGSVLVWHTHGRVFKPQLLQQVLRFVCRVYTVQ